MSNRQVILIPVFEDYASAEFSCEAEGCLAWLKVALQNMVCVFMIFEHLEKLSVRIIFLVVRVLCFLRLKTKDSLLLLELNQALLVFSKKQVNQSYERSVLPNKRDDIERFRKPFRA